MTEHYLPVPEQEIRSLQDKNVVIFGASGGLGSALAACLSSEGAHLFLLSRNIESVVLSYNARRINCDVRNPQSVQQAFRAIDEVADKIDCVINCAGVGLVRRFEETTNQEIDRVIGTNLLGTIRTSQEAYRRMITNLSGHIINVSSTSGLKARSEETIYCASKWGVRGFTESLRMEASAQRIRVTGIYPGGMRSENFWQITPGKNIEAFMDPQLIAEQIVNLMKSDQTICPSELVIERS